MSNQIKTDPKGVTPGLAPKAAAQPARISLKCKNPNHPCDSMDATEIKVDGPPHLGQRVYRCVKCGHTWSLAVGGAFNL